MRAIFTTILLLWLCYLPLISQTTTEPAAPTPKEKTWKCNGIIGLNANASAFFNWASGGNNSVAGNVFGNVTLLYQKDAYEWESNLDADFGLSWIDQTKYALRKQNDKLNFATKFGWKFKKRWYLTVLASFNTQFAEGYDYKDENKTYISNILNPSYTNLSVGIDWKPNEIFSVYLSPITGRITTATDTTLRSRYGVAKEHSYKAEFGLSFKGGINYTQTKNLKVISTLTLFTPYTSKFGNFDVDWTTAISYQFLKVLNVTLSTNLKYYDTVLIAGTDGHLAPRVQFQGGLGVGVGYSF